MQNRNEALIQRIDAEYQRGQLETRKAKDPADIPSNYECIDPEWFSHIVCKGHPEAKVIAFRPEAGDDLDRGHVRVWLTYNEAGKAAGLPSSVFCKDSQKPGMRLLCALSDTGRGEVIFYNQFRSLIDNIETPKCLHAHYNPNTFNSIVVMEDLTPQGAAFCTGKTLITRERIENQLAILARLHGRFYQKLDVHPVLSQWRSFSTLAGGFDKYVDMGKDTHRGFLGSEHVIPPRLYVHHAEIWPATVKSIDFHRTRPSTYLHADCHLRNWYVTAKGEMGLADWQLTAIGDWAFDVTYAMTTSLTVENRRRWEKELLRFYLDRLHEAGGPVIDFNEAVNNFRKHLFSSLAWWTPVVKPANEQEFQPLDDTFEIIKRITTAIDDLDALKSFD